MATELSPLYRPGGLWWDYDIEKLRPYDPGCPLIAYFPPPYHTLEVLAAARGFGGVKETEGVLTDTEWIAIKALQAKRFDKWAEYTRHIAGVLDLTVSECRMAYHLWTPLAVNSTDHESIVRAARLRMWDVLGFTCRHQDHAYTGYYDRVPWRMSFYGEEVTGDVQL